MVKSAFFISHAPDRADAVRTRVRQAAILKARDKDDLSSDENDWSIDYPVDIVEWLADMLESLEFKFTPSQILDTEETYPGLWNNISIVLWQRKIISEQEGG